MDEQNITKTCKTCKQTKPLSEFHIHRTNKDGRHSDCRACCSKSAKEYYRSERGKVVIKRYKQSEKGKAKEKRYNQSEKCKVTQMQYYQSEEGKDVRKRYQQSEKGKDNRRKALSRFRIRHPERRKAKEVVKHAIGIGKLPRPDSLKCHYCPAQAEQYHHPDYSKPLYVEPVCRKCHNLLHNRIAFIETFCIPPLSLEYT